MKIHFYVVAVMLVFLLIMDGAWLFVMMPRVYQKYLGHLLAGSLNVGPAVVFYLIYVFGLYFLVVRHALVSDALVMPTFIAGLVFGVVAYGTYDLTNQATLKNWPVIITVIDMAWGGMLSGTTAAVAVWAGRLFK